MASQLRAGVRAVARAVLALPALALPLAGQAQSPTLDWEPQWEGRFRPGGTTELWVRLQSPSAGTASIEVRSDGFGIAADLALEADRPGETWLPIQPAPDGRLSLEVRLPDGSHRQETIDLTPVEAFLRVGHPDTDPSAPGVAAAIRLPRTIAGYAPVGHLVLSRRDLLGLDQAQTRSLAHYLAGCGHLTLSGVAESELEGFRLTAGCGGSAIQSAARVPPEAQFGVTGDSSLPLYPEPDGSGVPGSGAQTRAALLLLPYLALLAALWLRGGAGPWVLALPAAMALILWSLIPRTLAPEVSVTWAETESGSPQSRYTRLMLVRGDGRDDRWVQIPGDAGLPRPLDGAGMALKATDQGLSLAAPPRLFQEWRFLIQGLAPRPLDLRVERDGRVWRLYQGGDRPIASAWLLDRECPRLLDPLPPGLTRVAATAPEDGSHPCPNPAPQGLPRPRGTALAIALDSLPGAGSAGLGRAGWLLVYPRRAGS